MSIIYKKCLVFPKKNRLLIPRDFQRVFKQGRKQRGGVFTLISCTNGFSHARLGLAVAKRLLPLAVERNRVRRVIRESFRQYQDALKGIDVVVIAQKELHALSNPCLRGDLHLQWQQLIGFLSA